MTVDLGVVKSKAEGFDRIAEMIGAELGGVKPQAILPFLPMLLNDKTAQTVYQFKVESDSVTAYTVFRVAYRSDLITCANCARSYRPFEWIATNLYYCNRNRKEANKVCIFYANKFFK